MTFTRFVGNRKMGEVVIRLHVGMNGNLKSVINQRLVALNVQINTLSIMMVRQYLITLKAIKRLGFTHF